jgi:hypothetical protein
MKAMQRRAMDASLQACTVGTSLCGMGLKSLIAHDLVSHDSCAAQAMDHMQATDNDVSWMVSACATNQNRRRVGSLQVSRAVTRRQQGVEESLDEDEGGSLQSTKETSYSESPHRLTCSRTAVVPARDHFLRRQHLASVSTGIQPTAGSLGVDATGVQCCCQEQEVPVLRHR